MATVPNGSMAEALALTLRLDDSETDFRAISPFREMGAYEALWAQRGTTFKSLAAKFSDSPGALPSDFVPRSEAIERAESVCQRFLEAQIDRFGVCVFGSMEYPAKLRDARYPVELMYFKGNWDLTSSPSIAVVGTRKPSLEGLIATHDVVANLVQNDFTVVSGLAAGVDRKAHETAIEHGGRTIAVLGTPLSYTYPRDNAELQRYISNHFLVISQVPLDRYEAQHYRVNRLFFPERNVTMSALTKATVIVEAGESSGTLTQARAAIAQKRKLLIHDQCFRNPDLTWPQKFVELGGIRVNDPEEICQHLSAPSE